MNSVRFEDCADRPPSIYFAQTSGSNFDPHELFFTNERAAEEIEAASTSDELKRAHVNNAALTKLWPTVQRTFLPQD